MDLGLANKIAMVGGASKGLGFAVARALALEGAQVSIASRDAAAIAAAAKRIQEERRESGAAVLAYAADLSTADAIAGWHKQTVDRFGGVDLLFANTGGPPRRAAPRFWGEASRAALPLLALWAV